MAQRRGRQRNEAFFAASGTDGLTRKALGDIFRRARGTGVLDVRNRGLAALPVAVCQLDAGGYEDDEKWWECVDLVAVDASNNELAALPPEFGNLATVSRLLLAKNALPALPGVLFGGAFAATLKVLDVAENRLAQLAPAVRCRSSQNAEIFVFPFVSFPNPSLAHA